MNSNAPIGIFDSGVGGTSIWKEIHKLLPSEHTVYLADSKHAPYGIRSKKEIIQLSVKNTEVLMSLGCKIIIVACNTATTNAISVLRENYDVPFIGIEPAIKPAAINSKTGSIGILATRGTLSSALFHKTSRSYAQNISVVEVVGEGLVPLIEEGHLNGPEMTELLERYTKPMIAANIDYLVLGCSHYPYLIPTLERLLPDDVKIIDSGAAVALQTKKLLEKNGLTRKDTSTPNLKFFSNLHTKTLNKLLEEFTGSVSISLKDF